MYIPLKIKSECDQIRDLFHSDKWFQLLTQMQRVNVVFKPAIILYIRKTIDELREGYKPLTSFNIYQVNRIVQKNRILHQTSEEYLSDLGNFS